MSDSFSPRLSVIQVLSLADWIVFSAALAATGIAVWLGHRRESAPERRSFVSFLVMGRKMTLPLFVASLVATWYGGIFGVTQITFEKGLFNFVTQGFFWYIAYFIFAIVFVRRARQMQSVTLPDLVGNLYGPKSRKIAAIFNFFNVVPVVYTMSLGLLIQALTHTSFFYSCALGTFLVVGYTAWGGMRAEVYSDLVQFFVMCSSVILVAAFSVSEWGGWTFLSAHLPPSHLTLTGGETWLHTLSWGLIATSTLVDPNFYQRTFAADSDRTARLGILISILIWFLFDICTTLGGLYARAVIPSAASGEAYLIYALQLLPAGFRGFFLAGIFATIISTMDSFLFIGATTFSYDLISKKIRHPRVWHSLAIIGVGTVSVLLSQMFDGNIRLVWKTLGSYWSACLLAPMVWGLILKRRLTDLEFVGTVTTGALATTYWRVLPLGDRWAQLDEIYIGTATTIAAILMTRGVRWAWGWLRLSGTTR